MTPKEIALNLFASVFTNFDPDAARDLLAEGYIQHNPGLPTGAAPVLALIPALEASGITITTHRMLSEGDLVVLHNTYENAQLFGGDTLVGLDVVRIADGQVVEHWDNLQPLAGPNVSGRTMTDGPTETTDLHLTARNKALVEDFAATVLIGGDFDRITDYISTETYHQHNPLFGDGLEALGTAFAELAEAGQAIAYTETHLIVAEGNFVFLASEGTFGDTPTAYFDLFRIDEGRIVEHWDVIEEIPSEMAHDNGKF